MEGLPEWASQEISLHLPQIRVAGESDTVEFKRAFPIQFHDLAEEIAAMASSGGGRIFIGVDNNGDLVGIDTSNNEERDKALERIHGVALTVVPVPYFELLLAFECNQTVLVIDIPKQSCPVYYYRFRPYVRDKRRARPASPEEVIELVWSHPSSECKKEMERIQCQFLERHAKRMDEITGTGNEQVRSYVEQNSPFNRRFMR